MAPKPASHGVVYLPDIAGDSTEKVMVAPLNFIIDKKTVHFPIFTHSQDDKEFVNSFLVKTPDAIPESWEAYNCKLLGTFCKSFTVFVQKQKINFKFSQS